MDCKALLTKSELTEVCRLIPGSTLKENFRRHPADFNRIKPGFRAAKLSDDMALMLTVNNYNEPFIALPTNTVIGEWVSIVSKSVENKEMGGLDHDRAVAEALSQSKFRDHIELYFKLKQEDVTDDYLLKIASLIEEINCDEDSLDEMGEASFEDSGSVTTEDGMSNAHVIELQTELEQLRTQINEANAKLIISDSKISELQLENQDLEQKIKITKAALEEATRRVQGKDDLEKYDDRPKGLNTVKTEKDIVSVCLVTEADLNGKQWLSRLADIRPDGEIVEFFCDDALYKSFENRDRLFPDKYYEPGITAVWEWSAIPNKTDPTRDYIQTQLYTQFVPIEICVLQDCLSLADVIDKLKAGISVTYPSRKLLIASKSKGTCLEGMLLTEEEFEESQGKIKIKSSIVSVPVYLFRRDETVKLENNKRYFHSLFLGVPERLVSVMDPLEVVKSAVMKRASWPILKEQGRTRTEYQSVKYFLANLDTSAVSTDVADMLSCTESEANHYVEEFLRIAQQYIDGKSLESEVVLAVLYSNDELMQKCIDTVRLDWEKENKGRIAEADADYRTKIAAAEEDYQRRLESQKKNLSDLRLQISEAEKEMQCIQKEYAEQQSRYAELALEIEQKEQLAESVDANVQARITAAQNDAAKFIADMAFVMPQSAHSSQEINTTPAITVTVPETHDGDYCQGRYHTGGRIIDEYIELHGNWNDLLEILSIGLLEAGVSAKFNNNVAAYLYSAFLNHVPLLLVGPNSSAIADAFSAALFGQMAGELVCSGNYSDKVVEECLTSGDAIVKIVNPFQNEWIMRIPEIIGRTAPYFIGVYPYAEDVQIEPRSLYNYMLPVMTEIFVEKSAEGCSMGGRAADKFTEFALLSTSRNAAKSYSGILKKMHTNLLIQNRIFIVLENAHAMLPSVRNDDLDVLMALLPYASATMQMDTLMDFLGKDGKLNLSTETKNMIEALYGDENV